MQMSGISSVQFDFALYHLISDSEWTLVRDMDKNMEIYVEIDWDQAIVVLPM